MKVAITDVRPFARVGGALPYWPGKPAVLMSLTAVSVVSLLLVLVMGYYSLRESRLADPDTHGSRVPSILAATFASAFLIFGWGFLG